MAGREERINNKKEDNMIDKAGPKMLQASYYQKIMKEAS